MTSSCLTRCGSRALDSWTSWLSSCHGWYSMRLYRLLTIARIGATRTLTILLLHRRWLHAHPRLLVALWSHAVHAVLVRRGMSTIHLLWLVGRWSSEGLGLARHTLAVVRGAHGPTRDHVAIYVDWGRGRHPCTHVLSCTIAVSIVVCMWPTRCGCTRSVIVLLLCLLLIKSTRRLLSGAILTRLALLGRIA